MPFFRNRKESELQREIAHHLRQLAAEFERQGYSRREAVRLANREFGGSEQTKERCRDERRWAWLTGLRQDVVFGLRMMRRTPVITAAAVLSLALGIGANTAIVSLMDVVLWRDLPVPSPKQLSLVHWRGHGFPQELANAASGSMTAEGGWDVGDFFSYPGYLGMRKSAAGMASVAAFAGSPFPASVSYAGRPVVAQERAVSGNFLSTLQVHPQIGRLLSDSDDSYAAPAAVVVSHRFWTRALGSDPGIAGRAVTVDNTAYVIAGVLEPAFYGLFPGDATDLYAPLHHAGSRSGRSGPALEDPRFWGVQVLARRTPGSAESELQPVLDTAFNRTWPAWPKDAAKSPHVLLEEGGRGLGSLRGEFRNSLLVLGGLVTLLLLIACTNIANLLLARAVARRKELAMRVSLGCGRARLMRQFVTESALLAAIGGAASIAVAYATAQLLGQFLAGRETLPIAVALDARALATVGGITMLALLAFGLFPAWQGSRRLDATWLKPGVGRMAHRGSGTGRVFVMAQMALSVVLVMTAVIFTRNLIAIQSTDPGFDRRNLILFGTRPGTSGYDKSRLAQFYFNLEERLRSTAGVSGVGLASMRPMNIGGWWETVRLAGQEEMFNVNVNSVTPTYLPLYNARMIAGRNLERGDMDGAAKVTVISEDLARKLGGPGVLGRRLVLTDGPPGGKRPEFEIVGIAPAIAATSIKERPYVVWLPFANDTPEATVVLRTSQPPQLVLPAIRQTMSAVDRNLPMVDTVTMEEQISKGLQRERMFATLCNGFGILALVLSVVGLYGVIAYGASRRRGEIGVRLALGATPQDVVSMVLREGLVTAVLGILAGVPVLWLGAKYLEKELTGMKALDPVSLLVALGILLVAALAAAGIPALRASGLDPAATLRQE